jgi:glucose dehydrogenase
VPRCENRPAVPGIRCKTKMVIRMNKSLFRVAVALTIASTANTQSNWPTIGANGGGQRYSTLRQVNRSNVRHLHVSWTYDTGLKGGTFEATPLVANGILYVSTPKDELIALNATTGKELWKYDTGEPSVRGSRGVSYWPGDRNNSPRIIMGTAGGLMIELEAGTGRPVDSFGDHGRINIVQPSADMPFRGGFQETSPPAIYKNLAIMAPATQEGPTRGETGNGDPRAFDILTGKQVWRFHSMPREGEFGSDTWGAPDGWKDRSGPSAWVPITIDEKKGVAFVATGNPADSYYGADRKGTNLYANCILALDAMTGQLLWYYQMVHHDLWDTDAVGTALIDTHRNGTTIPAVVGLVKTGLLFILNRATGKPIFGVEERPVAKSDVPGEQSWPTQPFPLKPPPLTRLSMTTADLTTMTPASTKACSAEWATAHNSGPYTPIGLTPTVNFPSAVGAANFGGVSVDPKHGYVFINTSEFGVLTEMAQAGRAGPTSGEEGAPANARGERGPVGAPMPYHNVSATRRFVGPDGFPCQQPPWGLLTAVNANTGNIAWQVPLGNYDDLAMADAAIPAPPLDAASLPDGPGKAETVRSCSTCHGLSTVTSLRLTKDGWDDVVASMVPRGFRTNDAEKALIIDYLATNLAAPAGATAYPPSRAGQIAPTAAHVPANAKQTGTPNIASSLVTAGGLVFIGGTLDNTFRAFDSQTGKELWSAKLDGVGVAGPMTYLGSDGKQIIVIDIGGAGSLRAIHNHASESPEEVVAFTLP